MDRDDIFVKTLVSLSELNSLVREKFFHEKLKNKIKNLAGAYIKFGIGNNDDVAQYTSSFEKIVFCVNDIMETIRDLEYLKLLLDSPLSLYSKKNILELKLELIRDSKTRVMQKEILSVQPVVKEKNNQPAIKNSPQKRSKLTENKQRILDFIKSYPNIRTKDIIQEFNVISDRTVKRNLTDLLHSGLIKKRIDNKAVYYYISE